MTMQRCTFWDNMNTTVPMTTYYSLLYTLGGGGAIQQQLDKDTIQLDNGIVLKITAPEPSHLELLRDVVIAYAKQVAPLLEAHIIRTLMLETERINQEWVRGCFPQTEISKIATLDAHEFPFNSC